MDPRIERSQINKHVRRVSRSLGHSLLWYEFLGFGEGSEYDQIYDTGPAGPEGRSYKAGISVPVLHFDESEDESRAMPDGRQPVMNISIKMLMDDMIKVGITKPWEYEKRLNDIFYFDGRYFSIYRYRARGSLKNEVIVAVQGIEIFPDQDYVFDNSPQESVQNLPWPDSLPQRGV
jgi:hypothetical protein